jgi:hypothetical protein
MALYSIRRWEAGAKMEMTMISGIVQWFADNAEQRDTRERRSITALAAFAFQYLHTFMNFACDVLNLAVTCQGRIAAAVHVGTKQHEVDGD